jgi:hypothetical protein
MNVNLPLRRMIAEKLLGQISWESEIKGTCKCPGADLHANPGATATVFLDAVPTLHCFHQSCAVQVANANFRLRSFIGSAEKHPDQAYRLDKLISKVIGGGDERPQDVGAGHTSPQVGDSNGEEEGTLRRLKMLARANLPAITAEFPIQPEEWCDISPILMPENREHDDWRLLLQVLPQEDRIWIGDFRDSGRPEHMQNFREVGTWLRESGCPGPFVCPACFQPSSIQRNEANVMWNRFVIVESDTLSKAEVGSVFLWLAKSWPLVAVVDTGNKSLHGWFERPQGLPVKTWKENEAVLEGFGCDVAMLRPSQPCRLPGWLREIPGRWQTLIYLDHMTTPVQGTASEPHQEEFP